LKELGEIASVALFEERAANSKPGFALSAKNAPWVIQICQRLDGIPLALELAAARTKVLSVDEIAARLDDRFSLLTAGNRTAIPRHQTLRAAIDWSHDLLTDPERILFRRLSVFAGSFTLDAVESICAQQLPLGNILDLLGRLVDKSLVIVEKARDVGQTRYRLLETIRQYALERLLGAGEAPAIRDRHLDFYVGLAERSEQNMIGSQAAVWFDRLDRELDNLRGAMEWSTSSGNAMAALRIAGSLVYFWFAHGLLASEWHDRIQQALSTPEGRKPTSARSKALNGIGFMYWADLYPIDRRPELEEALSIARDLGDAWNMATALRNLGLLENIQDWIQLTSATLKVAGR
jgi:predicted ATPase